MPLFDSILFDFDGVLMDSEPVHFACWREVLAPIGVTLDWDYYLEHGIGIDDKLMLQQLVGETRDWRELWAQYPAKKERFRSRMVAAPPFAEGLGTLLEELNDAYRLAIVPPVPAPKSSRWWSVPASVIISRPLWRRQRHPPQTSPRALPAGRGTTGGTHAAGD